MISTYRVNPDLSLPSLLWGLGRAVVRVCRAAVVAPKAIATGIVNLYVAAVVAAVVLREVGRRLVITLAVIFAVAGAIVRHKLFQFAVVAAVFVAAVVGLAFLVQAYLLFFVGGGITALVGLVTYPR